MTQTEFKDESTTVTLANGAVVEVADYHRVVKAFYKDDWTIEEIAAAWRVDVSIVEEIVAQELLNIDWMKQQDAREQGIKYMVYFSDTGLFFSGTDKNNVSRKTPNIKSALLMSAAGVIKCMQRIDHKKHMVIIDTESTDEFTPDDFCFKNRLGIL